MKFEGFDKDMMEEDGMLYEDAALEDNDEKSEASEELTEQEEETQLNEEERETELLKFYLEDIGQIPPADEEERELLMKKAEKGDRNASKRLVELYLMNAIQMAAKYRGKGIGLADLIQEANVGLMEAMMEEVITEQSILKAITNSLEQAVAKEGEEVEISEQIAARINVLNETSKELAERHGKEPTVKELAEYLKMTEEEVKSYMKISLDAIHVAVSQ